MTVFVTLTESTVCFAENMKPFIALRCGHGVCNDCFVKLGGKLDMTPPAKQVEIVAPVEEADSPATADAWRAACQPRINNVEPW